MLKQVLKEERLYDRDIERLQAAKKPVILFGAGCTSDFIVGQFRNKGINPAAFCDNDKQKIGTRIAGIEVISVEQLMDRYPGAWIYITTQMYFSEIRDQLMERGAADQNIIKSDLIVQFPWETDAIDYYMGKEEAVEELYGLLCDQKSQRVLENRLKFLYTRNRQYMTQIRDREQYFDQELLKGRSFRRFIDLGAFTGDSIEKFINYFQDYEHIWGFEPDQTLYGIARENLSQYKNITLVPCAASDFDGSMKVSSALGPMQTIDNQFLDQKEFRQEFNVRRLDTYFHSRNLTDSYIKLDIEGAELAALRGMEKLIQREAPSLAVCVYHKAEDILQIPALLRAMTPNASFYKFYLRHYSDNQTETVLYAIPS